MTGPCAKATVRCTLITLDGSAIVGTNYCRNPQAICPRAPGEGYEKCTTVCDQAGHAEAVAVLAAGDRARGARAYLEGHTYACMACQHALFGAGVASLSIGAPALESKQAQPEAGERERFEAWVRSRGLPTPTRDTIGYLSPLCHDQWIAWQAARTAPAVVSEAQVEAAYHAFITRNHSVATRDKMRAALVAALGVRG